jgi:CheY-like chemotaxis protein
MATPQEKKILVVDDEEDVIFFLTTALEDVGFQVDSAMSVDEALGKIKSSPPDCISLDMVMPGKSGIILFHELHRNQAWRKIPVLFVTGHARDEKVKSELDAAAALSQSTMSGPATYLEKPVTARKFVEAVAQAVKVELEGAAESRGDSPVALKEQLQELMDGADPDALRQALELLRRKSGS